MQTIEVEDGRGTTTLFNGYDHRGRRVYAMETAADSSVTEQFFVYGPEDQLVAVKTVAGANTTWELFVSLDGEHVFRLVMNGTSETERAFLYNDHFMTW